MVIAAQQVVTLGDGFFQGAGAGQLVGRIENKQRVSN
jgi:hypothetical protein